DPRPARRGPGRQGGQPHRAGGHPGAARRTGVPDPLDEQAPPHDAHDLRREGGDPGRAASVV
ncbi:MAG: hypothetical protein AVDCRST_MAG41-797, partial [uncultured Corynebacteriales bacterium]